MLRTVVVVGISAIVAACGEGTGRSSPAATTATSGSAEAPVPVPAVSVNALMVDLIDHSGHVLWDAERDDHHPATDGDWTELERHATQMAAAGTLLALGGTGVSDRIWSRDTRWQELSRELTDAGLRAEKAIEARDLDALVEANGQLVDVCERCHQAFKPEAPTEGITHKPNR